MTREEINNTVGAGAGNFMNYDLLKNSDFKQSKQKWWSWEILPRASNSLPGKHLGEFQKAMFPATNIIDRNTVSPNLLDQDVSNVFSQGHVVHSTEMHQVN